ncbi:nucleoside triphosphate pyrophosphohydrolase [Candidatus Schmidhempelia bombi]|uniref:Nucleoside triphosphate pyrophosphohydrolase n=1 Tax=Candidatus Schmidhempelia bombi str. Bimp TaxID=1387197 RepID=A0AB94ICC2_9GAMM|nr:nucleoside triphosphate pyrophosphohydrolase [Candidatus Schmidhempelia bombi]TEA27065.1 nucleoside triphosphate pyrophosphohydrolase [Candidatus Schmidhempelia bombi str. Bimp]
MQKTDISTLIELLKVMKQLRHPTAGCEWDRRQTFETLIPYTLEETYEVFDAIKRKDIEQLKNELGDLLYQIIFYAEIADEQHQFNFYDICAAIKQKLIRRHPTIFHPQLSSSTAIKWEQQKHQERMAKNQHSVLDDIPLTLPALMRAEKIQTRCASVGFDWTQIAPVIDKVKEELQEVMEEINQPNIDQEKLTEEVGDLLFATVNLSRHLGQKAETTLQQANQKFEQRFRQLETMITRQYGNLQNATLEQMEDAWQQIKLMEKIEKDQKGC